MNGDKILIIIDDIWTELILHEVGIPCGKEHKNCKILITSREETVCKAMKAGKIISVNPLPPTEAWTLFECAVGKDEWDHKMKEVAMDVVEECGGLPLFLKAVGNALKDKEIGIWVAALQQLRDPTDEELHFKKDGIMQLKLSFNHLESDLLKSCFLPCVMFPEDHIITLGDLSDLVLALERFNNLDGNLQLENVKNTIYMAIDSLKSSSLLLHVEDVTKRGKILFKMHDLVRDMAILVTSKGDNMYSVQSGKGSSEWQPTKYLKSCKKISLTLNNIEKLLHHELQFPHLDTFHVAGNSISVVPDNFFEGMEKLKVLDMSHNKISSLPRSLNKLIVLHTLDLNNNMFLSEVSVLGELTCLVILRLRTTGIKNIPKEIGQLHNLRLLDAYNCKDLSYVTSGVISKLVRLEELYVQIKKVNGDCSFIEELSELKYLKILHLLVPEFHNSLNDLNYKSLIEYNIGGGYEERCMTGFMNVKRCLLSNYDSFSNRKLVMKLISESDALRLYGMKDLDSLIPDLFPTTASSKKLSVIILQDCENVTSMVNNSVETSGRSNEVGPVKTKMTSMEGKELRYMGSFCNLMMIGISTCSSLLELFPSNVAQGLVNLRRLGIRECESLVVVILAGDEITNADRGKSELITHDTEVVFPQLTEITFDDLPKLECFYSGNSIMRYPSLKFIYVKNCGSMNTWSYGENDMPPNIKFDDDEGKRHSNINEYIAGQQHKDNWKLYVSAED